MGGNVDIRPQETPWPGTAQKPEGVGPAFVSIQTALVEVEGAVAEDGGLDLDAAVVGNLLRCLPGRQVGGVERQSLRRVAAAGELVAGVDDHRR